jgi:hypothetical protein
VLREAGAIAPVALPPLTPHAQISEAYSHYLREDRGLARRSIVHHFVFIRLFLREGYPGRAGRKRLRKFPPKLATDAYSMRTVGGKCCMGHTSSPWS